MLPNQLCQCLREDYEDLSEDVEDLAQKKGCEVVYPEGNQLQIDADSVHACAYFWQRLRELKRNFKWRFIVEHWSSKSGEEHRHFVVTVEGANFSIWERISFQTMLGSDPVREGMNTIRHLRGETKPCRLFRPIGARIEHTVPADFVNLSRRSEVL